MNKNVSPNVSNPFSLPNDIILFKKYSFNEKEYEGMFVNT